MTDEMLASAEKAIRFGRLVHRVSLLFMILVGVAATISIVLVGYYNSYNLEDGTYYDWGVILPTDIAIVVGSLIYVLALAVVAAHGASTEVRGQNLKLNVHVAGLP